MRHHYTYAVGDCHGCLDKLVDLIRQCNLHAGASARRFVFLGDYLDRGPHSQEVVNYLIALQSDGLHDVVCLLGNHEYLTLSSVRDKRSEIQWIKNGGDTTLASYGVSSASQLPERLLTWLDSLPTSFDDGKRFFVHAGVHPERFLDEQDEHDFLWMREPFLSSQKEFGRLVVHGHTPVSSGVPDLKENRLNLDTGAVYGRPLTAAVFSELETAPIRFLQSGSAQNPYSKLQNLPCAPKRRE